MKILLLEDDLELCKNIKNSLEKENYMVDCCNDGETAMLYALNTDYAYDIAIVDRMLPIPILIITAMSTLDNRVEGLDGGADDYLVKPFHIKELLARVRALTRRPANIQLSSKLQYGDLTFDKDSRTLSTPVNSILLTSKETELTFVFMQNPETLFSREQLILKIWGSSSEVETGNVDSYISFLRKRLKELKSSCKITTVYGAGYKLEKETC